MSSLSSLLPDRPKSSFITGLTGAGSAELKAALFQTERAVKTGAGTKRQPTRRTEKDDDGVIGTNSGVSARAAKDIASASSINASEDERLKSSYAHMQRKAAIYERLVSSGVTNAEGHEDTFMVDFERKGWERQDQLRDERALGDISNHAPATTVPSYTDASSAVPISSAAGVSYLDSHRLDWERAALADLATASSAAAASSSQSTWNEFAHSGVPSLSHDAKAALLQVIEDSSHSRQQLEDERHKRERAIRERIERIEAKEMRKRAFLEQHRQSNYNNS